MPALDHECHLSPSPLCEVLLIRGWGSQVTEAAVVTQCLGSDFHSGLDHLPAFLLTKPHLPELLLYLVYDFDGLVNLPVSYPPSLKRGYCLFCRRVKLMQLLVIGSVFILLLTGPQMHAHPCPCLCLYPSGTQNHRLVISSEVTPASGSFLIFILYPHV